MHGLVAVRIGGTDDPPDCAGGVGGGEGRFGLRLNCNVDALRSWRRVYLCSAPLAHYDMVSCHTKMRRDLLVGRNPMIIKIFAFFFFYGGGLLFLWLTAKVFDGEICVLRVGRG